MCFPGAAGASAADVLAAGRADVIANPAAWHGQYGGYMQVPKEMSASPFATTPWHCGTPCPRERRPAP